jgi:hypothetical protein
VPQVIGLIIAGFVAWAVVKDATALRNEEFAVLGRSGIIPGLWGVGVFLLMIVFLPIYLIVRSSHKKQLLVRCPRCGALIDRSMVVCPFCRQGLRPVLTAATPPGWHADPAGQHQFRYWDGTAWTSHVHNHPVVPEAAPVLEAEPAVETEPAAEAEPEPPAE